MNSSKRIQLFDRSIPLRTYKFCKHPPPCDAVMLFLVSSLILFGSIMVSSASYAYADVRYQNPYYFIERQLIWVILGYFVLYLSSNLKIDFYLNFTPILYLITVILLLFVLLIGTIGNGAQRWISIGPITIQPSEIAKTTLVMMLSWYFYHFSETALNRKNKKIR